MDEKLEHIRTFIDLFAGVGGFHFAFNTQNCVFASEIDTNAQETYILNFEKTPLFGDITKYETQAKIPKHFDILCAGFPCQPFSIAGNQKGFEDTRGTLFFEIARILKEKHPKYIILGNVKNLVNHNNGKTYQTIVDTLKDISGKY